MTKVRFIQFIFIGFLVLITSCETGIFSFGGEIELTEYDPDPQGKRLVIEAFFTNDPTESRLRLSTTVPLLDVIDDFTSVSDASVKVIEDEKNEYVFTYNPLTKEYELPGFVTQGGSDYRLEILADIGDWRGEVLYTAEETMPDPSHLRIDSITFEPNFLDSPFLISELEDLRDLPIVLQKDENDSTFFINPISGEFVFEYTYSKCSKSRQTNCSI